MKAAPSLLESGADHGILFVAFDHRLGSFQLGADYFRSAATKNLGIGVCSQARAQAGRAF